MASWDEHSEIQYFIYLLLGSFLNSYLIWFLIGLFQHWIVDNLIEERVPDMSHITDLREVISLMMNVLGIGLVLVYTGNMEFIWAVLGCLAPDILDGLRLILSDNGYEMWMRGDSQKYHIDFELDVLIDSKDNYKWDMIRRGILLIACIVVIFWF